jgi:EAL domain-containing protein (putative c-di-GMP-specific phosphodiesterase class I)
MYLAKERRTGIEIHAPDADRGSSARLSLLGELRRGIDRGELELHYLPKVFLADGWAGGMEALARWRHPRLGMIMPADFIPAAEQSCLMRDLTAYVVDAALAQAARWRQDGLPVQVSVNLCARDLLDGGLAEMVGRGLQRHGLLPGELMLEINEADG